MSSRSLSKQLETRASLLPVSTAVLIVYYWAIPVLLDAQTAPGKGPQLQEKGEEDPGTYPPVSC